MNIWKSIAGTLELELTSAHPEAVLQAVADRKIELTHVLTVDELTYRFRIHRKDLQPLAALCSKRGETLRILRRTGLYWQGKQLLARPVLLVGLFLLIALAMLLPTRIFFVQVSGNATIPARQILSAAEACGIRFGASRRDVRSEKVKNALLAAVPQLQWAGVNTSGCTATISVREKEPEQTEAPEHPVTSIVAARDGYILSATVTKGNPLFAVGQSVQKGQILISGYTDCGICIRAEQAEGEIYAQTRHTLTAVMPAERTVRGGTQLIRRQFSLILRKKRINLWKDSGISDSTCGRMYEEYYVTLPGGFQLPIALCIEEFTVFDTSTEEVSSQEAEAELSLFGERYLLTQMVAGEIRNRGIAVTAQNGAYRLDGQYGCTEMIGRVRSEQIGATDGKDD